jgi:hypothetical protein
MNLEMHPSVKRVAEFMATNLNPNELRGVANALATLAPSIWGQYPERDICPCKFYEPERLPPETTTS